MPDIFREPGQAGGEHEETAGWRARVEKTLARAPRRPVVVYVGTNQERRGYDTLLRLAVAEDAVFLHCGRLEPHDGPGADDVERLRAVLAGRDALLETAGPYVRPETADVFLRAAAVVALPYRRHLGSSGVMLQAVAAGRPVLVPDEGLMSFRAASFGLGATFPAGDEAALRRAFRAQLARRPDAYAPRLRAFTACFAPARLEAAVRAALTGAGLGAGLPQRAVADPLRPGGEAAWA
jgi:glycosyltransferase involved in cell wall biosynthesis